MFNTSSLLCKICVIPVESEGGKSPQTLAEENIVGFTDSSIQPQITISSRGDINATTTVTNASDMLDGKIEFIGQPIEISTTSEFNWAEIGFKLNKEQLETLDINNLMIYWYDEKNNEIVPQATKVDEESGVISTTVTHFSKYFVSYRININKRIDIAFVIDSKYSDQASLNTFKKNITNTILELSKKSDLRISFIDAQTQTKVYSFCIQKPNNIIADMTSKAKIDTSVIAAFSKVSPGGKTPSNQEILAVIKDGFTDGNEVVSNTPFCAINYKYVLIYTRWDAYFTENNSIIAKIGNVTGLIVGKTVAYYVGGEIAYDQSDVIPLTEFLYSGNYNLVTIPYTENNLWSLKQYGDNNKNDVIVLQKKLVTHGYLKMPIDQYTKTQVPFGTFDEVTKEAVEQYQSDKGLYVDGVVDKDTWIALTLPWDNENAQPDRSSWTYGYIFGNNSFYMVNPTIKFTSPASGTKAEVREKIKITVNATNCHHIALVIDGECIATIYGEYNVNVINFEYDYRIPCVGTHSIEIRGRNVPGSNDGNLVISNRTVEGIYPEPEVDGKVIGSQDYIDMIDEIYDETWSETYLEYVILLGAIIADYEAKIVASSKCMEIIMSDVKNNSIKLNYISDYNFLRLCEKVNSLVRKQSVVSQELHYFRNYLNRVPKTLNELIDENSKLSSDEQWQLMSIDRSLYHMQQDGGLKNLKFVSADGRFEAVYNEYGLLVTDSINMGTYNYAPSITEGHASHKKYDVNPYEEWGNTSDSPQKGKANIDEAVELVKDQLKGDVEEDIEDYRQELIDMYGFIEI